MVFGKVLRLLLYRSDDKYLNCTWNFFRFVFKHEQVSSLYCIIVEAKVFGLLKGEDWQKKLYFFQIITLVFFYVLAH